MSSTDWGVFSQALLLNHSPRLDDLDDGGDCWFNSTSHTVRADEFIIQTFEVEHAQDMVKIGYL